MDMKIDSTGIIVHPNDVYGLINVVCETYNI